MQVSCKLIIYVNFQTIQSLNETSIFPCLSLHHYFSLPISKSFLQAHLWIYCVLPHTLFVQSSSASFSILTNI